MPNSPDPLLPEDEAEVTTTPDTENNFEYQARTSASIGDLRRRYGPHFAPGYEDSATLGELLAHAGLNTLEQYLQRHPIGSGYASVKSA
jgi:hypothetical protein